MIAHRSSSAKAEARRLRRRIHRHLRIEELEPRIAPAASLPGLQPVDADILENVQGQVVYLDFDGAKDVTYNGPVTVTDIDVPTFSAAAAGLAGKEAELEQAITAEVGTMLAPLGVTVTAEKPTEGPYSTIYIGGDDRGFAEYGHFDGLAEKVDVGNQDASDIGFVFTDDFRGASITAPEYAAVVSNLAAHEAGHLLGVSNKIDTFWKPSKSILEEVAHKSGPDDGEDISVEGPVHQYLTYQAWQLYNSQFTGSELGQAIGIWTDCGQNHHTAGAPQGNENGIDNDVIEGVFDEDVAGEPWGFHGDIAPQNPFEQARPYTRHFSEGGDADELTIGLPLYKAPIIDAADKPLRYFSGYEQAKNYWDGWTNGDVSFEGLVRRHDNNMAASAYYYVGHVAHLLQDMTVPAHVHNDVHWPIVDLYETDIADPKDGTLDLIFFTDYTWQDAYGGVRPYGSLIDLFRETANYTEDYNSDDYFGDWGTSEAFDTDRLEQMGLSTRHQPALAAGIDQGTALVGPRGAEITADDLMPFAIEQTAALYRLFYSVVDTTPPTVSINNALSTTAGNPITVGPKMTITALATDSESGVDKDGYTYTVWKKTGGSYPQSPCTVSEPGAGNTWTTPTLPAGDYKLEVTAVNGGGSVGHSVPYYFTVTDVSSDHTYPTVQIPYSDYNLSDQISGAATFRSSFPVGGSATDSESGVDPSSYHFQTERLISGAWGDFRDWGACAGTATMALTTEGLYRIRLSASDWAEPNRHTGYSPYYYFKVEVPQLGTGLSKSGDRICDYSGDGDEVAEAGETAGLWVRLLNDTGSPMTDVKATLNSTDSHVLGIITPHVIYGDIAAYDSKWSGGYSNVVFASSSTSYSVPFTMYLEYTQNGQPYCQSLNFTQTVHYPGELDPKFDRDHIRAVVTATSDGDDIAESGEDVDFDLYVQNVGGSTARDVGVGIRNLSGGQTSEEILSNVVYGVFSERIPSHMS